MSRKLIAGNWKMHLDLRGSRELARVIVQSDRPEGVVVVLCPPFVYLQAVVEEVSQSGLGVGAQNMYAEPSGAFTGEIAAPMLVDLGCSHVILGHSERRAVFGETDELVQRKVHAALEAGLRPIVCLGESLEQRQAGETLAVIRRQFENSLAGIEEEAFARVVIAYEPVWAIGTGHVATPLQAEQVHADLRKLIENRYNSSLADQVSILYGGSVKPDNAAELLAQDNIDGALVGGASLKSSDFLAIIQAA